MTNLKKNSKGFTLIELLAVIVILGVLMIIAVPMVTQYITSAKKGAFVSTAKAYVSSARYAYLNGDYTCTGNSIDTGAGGSLYITFRQIDVDKTGGKSSFGQEIDLDKSYVVITSDSDGRYTYYVRMIDKGSNGWDKALKEDDLIKHNVKTNSAKNDTALGLYKYSEKEDKTATSSCQKSSVVQ